MAQCPLHKYPPGAMSLVNDQIKTVVEGVLRVCIPSTWSTKAINGKIFENLISFVLGRFLFHK